MPFFILVLTCAYGHCAMHLDSHASTRDQCEMKRGVLLSAFPDHTPKQVVCTTHDYAEQNRALIDAEIESEQLEGHR